jgi:hypothetical protein
VDVVADLPTDAQSPEPVQQRERLLDDPPILAQPGAVRDTTPGDDRRDTDFLDLRAVLVMVIRTVGEHRVRSSPRPTATAPYRRNGLDQRYQLSHIVAVAAGQDDSQRDTVPLGDQVMFRARPGTIDRARPSFGPPFIARRCDPSTTALDQSS